MMATFIPARQNFQVSWPIAAYPRSWRKWGISKGRGSSMWVAVTGLTPSNWRAKGLLTCWAWTPPQRRFGWPGKKIGGLKKIQFRTGDIYKVDSLKGRFEIAVARGILHHLYDLPKAVRALSLVADEIIVVEPNGYNPILKMIEKISNYHIEHEEKSYFPFSLRHEFERNGGKSPRGSYRGLVPFFAPIGWPAF